MKMKGLNMAILVAWGSILFANAQQSTGYFFKDFTSGKVLLRNQQFAKGKFNYDCINKKMHFLNGATDMVVENLDDIDTIVIDKHQFIPFEGHFLEVMTEQQATLFIDWKINLKSVGKKGAMGIITQGSVQAIDVNAHYQRVNGEQDLDLSVYRMATENTYYIYTDGKWKKFRNAKTLLSLFPKEKQQELNEFIEKEKVDFEKPEEILNVLSRF